jgi:hypothetical protein
MIGMNIIIPVVALRGIGNTVAAGMIPVHIQAMLPVCGNRGGGYSVHSLFFAGNKEYKLQTCDGNF